MDEKKPPSTLRQQIGDAIDLVGRVERWLTAPYNCGVGSPPDWFPEPDRVRCLAIQRRIFTDANFSPRIDPSQLAFWMECARQWPESERVPIEYRDDVQYLNRLLDAFVAEQHAQGAGLKMLVPAELVEAAQSGRRFTDGQREGPAARKARRLKWIAEIKGAVWTFREHRPDTWGWGNEQWIEHFTKAGAVIGGKDTDSEAAKRWRVDKAGGPAESTFIRALQDALRDLRREGKIRKAGK